MADGVELAVSYISVTLSAQGVAKDIDRQITQPIQQSANRASLQAQQSIQRNLAGVKVDGERMIGAPLRAAAVPAASAARVAVERQLGTVSGASLQRSLVAAGGPAGVQAGTAARRAIEAQLGAVKAPRVAGGSDFVARNMALMRGDIDRSLASSGLTTVRNPATGGGLIGVEQSVTATRQLNAEQARTNAALGTEGPAAAQRFGDRTVGALGRSSRATIVQRGLLTGMSNDLGQLAGLAPSAFGGLSVAGSGLAFGAETLSRSVAQVTAESGGAVTGLSALRAGLNSTTVGFGAAGVAALAWIAVFAELDRQNKQRIQNALPTEADLKQLTSGIGQKALAVQVVPNIQEGGDKAEAQFQQLITTIAKLTPEQAVGTLKAIEDQMRATGSSAVDVAAAHELLFPHVQRVGQIAKIAAEELAKLPPTLDDVKKGLADVAKQAEASRAGIEANAAAAAAFSQSIDDSTSLDNQIAAGVSLAQARKDFTDSIANLPRNLDPNKIGLGIGTGTITKIEEATTAVDRLANSVDKFEAKARLATLQFDAMGAGATAFSASIERSTSLDNTLGAAVGISDAIQNWRDHLSDLPRELDATKLAFNSLRTDAGLPGLTGGGADEPALAAFMTQALARGLEFNQKAFDDFKKTFQTAPTDDNSGAARASVSSTLQLAQATRAYLATLVGTHDYPLARENSAKLRAEYLQQLATVGIVGKAAEKYIETLGLTPKQVETAIVLSGAEEARFKINALLSLVGDNLSDAARIKIAASIDKGDLDKAAADLARFAGTAGALVKKKTSESSNDSLQTALALGAAAKDAIAERIAAGDTAGAAALAESIRSGIGQQLAAAGFSLKDIATYVNALGLNPDAVAKALADGGAAARLSNINSEMARTADLLNADYILKIDTALAKGDLEEVLRLLGEARKSITLTAEQKAVTDTFGAGGVFGIPVLGGEGAKKAAPKKPPAASPTAPHTGGLPTVPVNTGASRALGLPDNPRDGFAFRDRDGDIYKYIAAQKRWYPAPKFAVGGMVPGFGSGDTVPAMLTPGEFVMRKAAVESIGLAELELLNRRGFAAGGLVTPNDAASFPMPEIRVPSIASARAWQPPAGGRGSEPRPIQLTQTITTTDLPRTHADTVRALRDADYLAGV